MKTFNHKEQLILKNRLNQEKKVMYTYQNLKEFVANLTDTQLAQQVQLLGPDNHTSLLCPVIGGGTVEEMCHVDGVIAQTTHSVIDFEHHPEQVILLSDHCPFSEEGDQYYTMDEDEDGEPIMIGNKTGKPHHIVKRERCEPTIKASRTPAFDKRQQNTDEELMAAQEEFARLSKERPLSTQELSALDFIQAELYRRIYHLNTKEEILTKQYDCDEEYGGEQ